MNAKIEETKKHTQHKSHNSMLLRELFAQSHVTRTHKPQIFSSSVNLHGGVGWGLGGGGDWGGGDWG